MDEERVVEVVEDRSKKRMRKKRMEQNLVESCWVSKMQFYLKVGKSKTSA